MQHVVEYSRQVFQKLMLLQTQHTPSAEAEHRRKLVRVSKSGVSDVQREKGEVIVLQDVVQKVLDDPRVVFICNARTTSFRTAQKGVACTRPQLCPFFRSQARRVVLDLSKPCLS